MNNNCSYHCIESKLLGLCYVLHVRTRERYRLTNTNIFIQCTTRLKAQSSVLIAVGNNRTTAATTLHDAAIAASKLRPDHPGPATNDACCSESCAVALTTTASNT